MDENPQAPPAEFQCSDILFRALPVYYLVREDGTHHPKVFIRRENHPAGLSLFTTIRGCKENPDFQNPIFGVRSVHVGRLRDNGLEVFPTSDTHANIRYRDGTNLPLRREDEIRAKNMADLLMELSRPVSYWNEENADGRFQLELEAKRAKP
jgi:hypothetical protein